MADTIRTLFQVVCSMCQASFEHDTNHKKPCSCGSVWATFALVQKNEDGTEEPCFRERPIAFLKDHKHNALESPVRIEASEDQTYNIEKRFCGCGFYIQKSTYKTAPV